MPVDYRGQTALITGASSGLGVEFARQLAVRGADLVLVARRADRLEALAAEVRAAHGVTVHVIPADLAAPEPGARLTKAVSKLGVEVDTVIANAGFGTFGRFEDEDPARVADEIALNVGAVVDVARAFYPGMLQRGRGALVTVASTAAYQPVPKMAVYAATKAFVLSFTEALWFEARRSGSGLRVLALSPGATETEFFDVAGNGDRFGSRRQPAADVVALTLRTLDRRTPPPSVVSGLGNRITAALAHVLPRRLVIAGAGRLSGV